MMKMEFTVSLIQAPCFEGRRERNFKGIRSMLEQIPSSDSIHLVILPELFAIGFRHEDYRRLGAGVPGCTSDFLCETAEEFSIYLIGTGIEESAGKFYNTLVLASPEGHVVGAYRKIHPFQEEKDVFLGGSTITMFRLGELRVGVEICYDIRFPEVSRRLALEGAQVILVPAAFPDPRAHHWDTLVMARAIENQVFIAAANRVGQSFDGKTYFGHSQVVDPLGVRFTRINSEVDVITHKCNTKAIESARSQITCYKDRAPEKYEKVTWFE